MTDAAIVLIVIGTLFMAGFAGCYGLALLASKAGIITIVEDEKK